MKRFKTALWVLMLLSAVIAALMIPFMPDRIPAHYNAAGEVDRLGSRYESLVFPAVTAAMGLFFLFMEKHVIRVHRGKMSRAEMRAFYVCAIATLLLFIGMGIFFMGKSIAYGYGGAV